MITESQIPGKDEGAAPLASGCPFHVGAEYSYPGPRAHPMAPPSQYEQWTRDQPVIRVKQWNGAPAWFVTNYNLIRSLLMDRRTSADAGHPSYPAQNAALSLVRREYQVFAQMDPPDHTAERKLLAGEFSVRRIELMRPQIQALADRLIDDMRLLDKPVDLVTAYTSVLPCHVICMLLGIPEEDYEATQEWSRQISSLQTTHDEAANMIQEFCDGYLADLVERKARAPGDDLLSRLITGPMSSGQITARKVVSLARLFLTAGQESTAGTLGVGMAALLYNPEQLALLREDPSLIKGATEEILRYTDITHSGRLRIAKEDIEIGGVVIREGEAIIMHQPTADRDPDRFPNPHVFDITRTPQPHLAFGIGIHQCIGQPLARMEIETAVGTLVRRLPRMEPTLPMEQLDFHHKMAIYGLRSLPVTW